MAVYEPRISTLSLGLNVDNPTLLTMKLILTTTNNLLFRAVGFPATQVNDFVAVAEVIAGVVIRYSTALGIIPANPVHHFPATTQVRARVVRFVAAQAVHVTIKAEI